MIDGMDHFGEQEAREKMEWLEANGGDGLLVRDFNQDGSINDASELFGTPGPNGEQ